MEQHIWDYFKTILQLAVIPLVGFIWKSQINQVAELEKELDMLKASVSTEINNIKIENATVKAQLMSITERLGEIKAMMNMLLQEYRK